MRKAAVSFIRLERLSLAEATEEGHMPIAPDLAVEVISPNDIHYETDLKVEDYQKGGVSLVWVINPKTRTVIVHRLHEPGTVLHENDELTGEDVLPGFRCREGDLFVPPTNLPSAGSS